MIHIFSTPIKLVSLLAARDQQLTLIHYKIGSNIVHDGQPNS